MAFRKLSALLLTGLAVGCAGLVAACTHGGMYGGADVGLFFNQSGPSATLAYGRANSDDVGLVLQCQSGSGQVDVSDVARSAKATGLTLTSGGAVSALPARLDTSLGQPTLWARTSMAAPALRQFRGSGQLAVAAPGGRYAITADRNERGQVERFFRACEKA